VRAVLYCRVSTEEQTKNMSLPTQEKACREYCARQGYDVERVFIDAGASAKSTDRPEFLRLLAYCREQKGRVHAVVVYSLTRFSRQQADHHAIQTLLRGLGINLRSVTEPIDESPTGRLMEGILAAMAQFDNDVKSERAIAGMKAVVERGRWCWRAPLGYLAGAKRSGPSLVLDPARAPHVREAFILCAAGIRGRALIQRLTAMGLRTRHGHALTTQTLYPMLQSRVYVGVIHTRGFAREVRGDFEPLIDDDTFGQVQAQLAAAPTATRAIARHRDHPDFPLRRFARCAVCDRALTGSWSKGRTRKYAFYHCPKGCTRVTPAALESVFLGVLDRLRPRPERWAFFRSHVVASWEENRQAKRTEAAAIQKQLDTLETKALRLDEVFIFQRAIDAETYHAQRDVIRQQIAVSRIDLSHAADGERIFADDLAFAGDVLTRASEIWTAAPSIAERQRVQWTLFPLGITVADGRGSTTAAESAVVEPQIRAVSCWDFFELPDVSSVEAENGAPYSRMLEPVVSWVTHMCALRVAA
jgi:DNA invertase Pin-like site-specific DNA recombinase